jgi:arylformamidase
VKGAVPVSGLFDLEPASRCFANEWLQLTSETARELSPAHSITRTDLSLLLAYADGEPEGFKAQSKTFLAAWRRSGNEAELFEIPARNHFDVILDLADGSSQLFRQVLRMVTSHLPSPNGK